eukprot:314495-Prymnesium_polylepis.1
MPHAPRSPSRRPCSRSTCGRATHAATAAVRRRRQQQRRAFVEGVGLAAYRTVGFGTEGDLQRGCATLSYHRGHTACWS